MRADFAALGSSFICQGSVSLASPIAVRSVCRGCLVRASALWNGQCFGVERFPCAEVSGNGIASSYGAVAWRCILHRSFWEMQELTCCAAPVAEGGCSSAGEHFPRGTARVIKVTVRTWTSSLHKIRV